MALEFKKYEGGSSELTSEGTVLGIIGKKGNIGIIPKNFKDTSKRVALILTNSRGESTVVACSKAVSEGLRNKSITMNHVAGFEILTNENDQSFISMPANSGGLVTFTAAELTVEEFVPSVMSYEDLAV